MKKPILYFNFNRPQCTEKSFDPIKKYKPDRLYISIDGPRKQNVSDKENVAKTKSLLSRIDWKCDVTRWYSRENLGCKKSVQRGLARFFEIEEDGIILEDDCVASPSFFKFTETLLDKYKFDERIAVIHGSSLGFKPAKQKDKDKESYFFTQFMNMWGWATWRRTYALVDNKMSVWKLFDNKHRFLDRLFSYYGSERDHKWLGYWHYQFSKTAAGEIDTWDFQWIFNLIEKQKFCIAPRMNMVKNVGWGAGATHTIEENSCLAHIPCSKMSFPLVHPKAERRANLEYEAHIKEVWCSVRK